MSKFLIVALSLFALVLAACAGAATPAAKTGTIRVALSTDPDVGDIPTLLAHELLQQQGYTIQLTPFASPDLSVAALAKGDMDIGTGSTRTHWAAVQKGANIRTLMEQSADVWSLVTAPQLTKCEDLNGRRVAVNSAGSITKALIDAYILEKCPGVKPEILYVSGSDNRSAALQKGDIDASLLEIADVVQLNKLAPGKFHVLINFADALPGLKTTGINVNGAFAQQHPDIIRDYITAVLTTNRQIIQNPKLLTDAMVKYLKMDPATAQEIATAYLAQHVWNENGGLTTDDVQYSLDFFINSNSLPAGIQANQVSDLSYLTDVLKTIGSK